MLQVTNLSFSLPDRPLLRDVDIAVNRGTKIGIVGVNGAGKSTLIKIIAGMQLPDTGTISKPENTGYVPQTVTVTEADNARTVLDYMSTSRGLSDLARRIQSLERQMESSPSSDVVQAYSDAMDEYTRLGGWESEGNMARMLAGIGLKHVTLDTLMGTLSGGQKTRVAIARVLFQEPDLLLMDEPTNHLDVEAKKWLMSYLAEFSGALLIVSHDIPMLDKSINKILYVNEHTQTIEQYAGTYSAFMAQKDAVDQRTQRTLTAQRGKIKSLQKTALSLVGGSEQRARRGKSILRRVERMKDDLPDAPQQSRVIKVDFPVSRRGGDIVLRIDQLSKSYGKTEIVKPLTNTLVRGKKWAVIGVNGAGKTTLLRMIAGFLEPTHGQIELGTGIDVGYYAQEHEKLDPNVTVLEEARKSSRQPDGYLRNALAQFLFLDDRVFEPVHTLSGGERSRLALCKLVLEGHNFLLLDEPTNNLDTLSSQRLLEALKDYEGTMMIVSHDLDFLQAINPDMAILMPESTFVPFNDRVFGRVSMWNL